MASFTGNSRSFIFALCCTALLLLTASLVQADVKLPRLLSDGAVLQRDKPVRIWGWADNNEAVRVTFAGRELNTNANDGRWSVEFPPLPAGGPHQLQVKGNNTLIVDDIWMGDLWIAAGQSNMELPLRRVQIRYPDLIPNTQLPKIREFSVPLTYTFKENAQDYSAGEWKTATPEHLPGFSAVGFFFARQLHEQYQVPIGIVSIAVGGSPVEAWMSEKALQKYQDYLDTANTFKDDAVLQQTIARDKANSDAWYAGIQREDQGLQQKTPWSSPDTNTQDWQTFRVPGFFAEQKINFKNGVVWLKKTFELTAEQAQKKNAQLFLGVLVDGDQTFVNGTSVGQIGYRYPPRIYPIPENVLKAGKNEVTVRLVSYSSDPGFIKDKTYALTLADTQIDLQGKWQYKIGLHAGPIPASTTLHYQPTTLFKAKLAPAFPLGIKGAIWFQGESNVSRAKLYFDLFPQMIADWRAHFNQGDFPFLYAQLANYLEASPQPVDSDWALLREAQREALSVPNTGMAVTIDVGEWNDIHPLNKQAVGERLALAAQKIAYGEKNLLASGPQVKSVKRRGKQLVIEFSDVGTGLKVQGEQPLHIAIAGEDEIFHWATARLDGNTLRVWSEAVPKPMWVRYAWANNPEGGKLYNSAGLPASPFEERTP